MHGATVKIKYWNLKKKLFLWRAGLCNDVCGRHVWWIM